MSDPQIDNSTTTPTHLQAAEKLRQNVRVALAEFVSPLLASIMMLMLGSALCIVSVTNMMFSGAAAVLIIFAFVNARKAARTMIDLANAIMAYHERIDDIL